MILYVLVKSFLRDLIFEKLKYKVVLIGMYKNIKLSILDSILIFMICFFSFSVLFLHNTVGGEIFLISEYEMDSYILGVIFIILSMFIMEIPKLLSIILGWQKAISQENIKGPIRDWILNCSIFLAMMSGVYTQNLFLDIISWIFFAFNIIRISRFQIFGEILFANKLWIKRKTSFNPMSIFFHGVVGAIVKAFFFTILGFSIGCLLIIGDQAHYYDRIRDFSINNPSGYVLIDFVYFAAITITTVGYGDISPISVEAKLFCAAMILFSYVILVAFLGVTISAISSGVKSTDHAQILLKSRKIRKRK